MLFTSSALALVSEALTSYLPQPKRGHPSGNRTATKFLFKGSCQLKNASFWFCKIHALQVVRHVFPLLTKEMEHACNNRLRVSARRVREDLVVCAAGRTDTNTANDPLQVPKHLEILEQE